MNALDLLTPLSVVCGSPVCRIHPNGWRWRVVCCIALVDVDLDGPLVFDHHERGHNRTMYLNFVGSIDFV